MNSLDDRTLSSAEKSLTELFSNTNLVAALKYHDFELQTGNQRFREELSRVIDDSDSFETIKKLYIHQGIRIGVAERLARMSINLERLAVTPDEDLKKIPGLGPASITILSNLRQAFIKSHR